MIDVINCEASGPALVIVVTEVHDGERANKLHVYTCHDEKRVCNIIVCACGFSEINSIFLRPMRYATWFEIVATKASSECEPQYLVDLLFNCVERSNVSSLLSVFYLQALSRSRAGTANNQSFRNTTSQIREPQLPAYPEGSEAAHPQHDDQRPDDQSRVRHLDADILASSDDSPQQQTRVLSIQTDTTPQVDDSLVDVR